MRKLTFGLGIALVVAAFAAPAVSASAPREVVQWKDVATLHFTDNTACLDQGYSFTYTGDYLRTRSTTLWYDDEGNVVKEFRMIHFKGVETNDSDPTKFLEVHGTRLIVFDFVAGTATETGSNWHITVPGEGVVLLQAGRQVYTVDFGELLSAQGPHEGVAGQYAEYCAALA